MQKVRVLNKTNNEIFYTTVEIPDFCVQIPDDEEFYKWDGEKVTIDINKKQEIEQEKINYEARKFLTDTDWKVIRHRDQLALGITTSMTTEEFQNLLDQRQKAREKVIEVQNVTG